jgi:thioester reductase-like protein
MSRSGYDSVHLVVGYPYFRGRKVVEHVLRAEPRALIYVVVAPEKAREAEEARARLAPAERDRLVMLDGDVASIDMGLSGSEYRTLAREVERIHHAAQVTYLAADRRVAEALNVATTREVLELGRACESLAGILVYSSAMVSGSRTGVVLEDELNVGQSFRSSVEETLALGERMARRAMRDLPVVVVRPSQIIGDSATGEVERFDGLYLLILLIVSSPQEFPLILPTRGDVPLHVVPIDYVVRAAHYIGRQPRAIGRTFHLVDPQPLSVRQVFDLVAERGGRMVERGSVPTQLVRALFSTAGVGLVPKSPLALLDLIATQVRYGTQNSQELLLDSGIECPPFETYVDQMIDYVKLRVDERSQRPPPAPADEIENEHAT